MNNISPIQNEGSVKEVDIKETEILSEDRKLRFRLEDVIVALRRNFKTQDVLKSSIEQSFPGKGGFAGLIFEEDIQGTLDMLTKEFKSAERSRKQEKMVGFLLSLPEELIDRPVVSLQKVVNDDVEVAMDSLPEEIDVIEDKDLIKFMSPRINSAFRYLRDNFSEEDLKELARVNGYDEVVVKYVYRDENPENLMGLIESGDSQNGLAKEVISRVLELADFVSSISVLDVEFDEDEFPFQVSGESLVKEMPEKKMPERKIVLDFDSMAEKELEFYYAGLPLEQKNALFTDFLDGKYQDYKSDIIVLLRAYLKFREENKHNKLIPFELLHRINSLESEMINQMWLKDDHIEVEKVTVESGSLKDELDDVVPAVPETLDRVIRQYQYIISAKEGGIPLFEKFIRGRVPKEHQLKVAGLLRSYVSPIADRTSVTNDANELYAKLYAESDKESVVAESLENNTVVDKEKGEDLNEISESQPEMIMENFFGKDLVEAVKAHGVDSDVDWINILLESLYKDFKSEDLKSLVNEIKGGNQPELTRVMAITYKKYKKEIPVALRSYFQLAYKQEFGLVARGKKLIHRFANIFSRG